MASYLVLVVVTAHPGFELQGMLLEDNPLLAYLKIALSSSLANLNSPSSNSCNTAGVVTSLLATLST